jgi:hypothetical protein
MRRSAVLSFPLLLVFLGQSKELHSGRLLAYWLYLNQGTITESEGSVRLTLLGLLVFVKMLIMFSISKETGSN